MPQPEAPALIPYSKPQTLNPRGTALLHRCWSASCRSTTRSRPASRSARSARTCCRASWSPTRPSATPSRTSSSIPGGYPNALACLPWLLTCVLHSQAAFSCVCWQLCWQLWRPSALGSPLAAQYFPADEGGQAFKVINWRTDTQSHERHKHERDTGACIEAQMQSDGPGDDCSGSKG